jgi:opacity protein-like surface antigen
MPMTERKGMKSIRCAALVVLLAASGAACADNGLYLGLAGARSAISFNADNFGSGTPTNAHDRATSNRASSFKLFAGYDLGRWGIEGGFVRHGSFQFRSTNIDKLDSVFDYAGQSWFMAATGRLPLISSVSLLGKLGVSFNRAATTYSNDVSHVDGVPKAPQTVISMPHLASRITPGTYRATTTAPLLGIGLEYSATKSVRVRLEYESFGRFGNQTSTGRANIVMTSLGLIYAF